MPFNTSWFSVFGGAPNETVLGSIVGAPSGTNLSQYGQNLLAGNFSGAGTTQSPYRVMTGQPGSTVPRMPTAAQPAQLPQPAMHGGQIPYGAGISQTGAALAGNLPGGLLANVPPGVSPGLLSSLESQGYINPNLPLSELAPVLQGIQSGRGPAASQPDRFWGQAPGYFAALQAWPAQAAKNKAQYEYLTSNPAAAIQSGAIGGYRAQQYGDIRNAQLGQEAAEGLPVVNQDPNAPTGSQKLLDEAYNILADDKASKTDMDWANQVVLGMQGSPLPAHH